VQLTIQSNPPKPAILSRKYTSAGFKPSNKPLPRLSFCSGLMDSVTWVLLPSPWKTYWRLGLYVSQITAIIRAICGLIRATLGQTFEGLSLPSAPRSMRLIMTCKSSIELLTIAASEKNGSFHGSLALPPNVLHFRLRASASFSISGAFLDLRRVLPTLAHSSAKKFLRREIPSGLVNYSRFFLVAKPTACITLSCSMRVEFRSRQ